MQEVIGGKVAAAGKEGASLILGSNPVLGPGTTLLSPALHQRTTQDFSLTTFFWQQRTFGWFPTNAAFQKFNLESKQV